MKRFLVALVLVSAALSTKAAEITWVKLDSGIWWITITGEIEAGDDQKVLRYVDGADYAVISLSSDGGNVFTAMRIGEEIRRRKFATWVDGSQKCVSACALIWLSGTPRVAQYGGSYIGFHAAYTEQNGYTEESGIGNAMIGAYLTKLGLGYSAVAFITQAPPDSVNWLTPETGKENGIKVALVSSVDKVAALADHRAPKPQPPPVDVTPQPVAPTPPPAQPTNSTPSTDDSDGWVVTITLILVGVLFFIVRSERRKKYLLGRMRCKTTIPHGLQERFCRRCGGVVEQLD